MTMDEGPARPGLDARLIDGRPAFQAAVRELLAQAAAAGCRELCLCDVDYADWPLGERAVVDSLTAWAYSHRRLVMLASRYDAIVERQARFVAWRRQWAHVMECRVLEDVEADRVPSLLLAPGLAALRLADRVHVRGRVSLDLGECSRWRESFDALAQRSPEGFAAHTLGL